MSRIFAVILCCLGLLLAGSGSGMCATACENEEIDPEPLELCAVCSTRAVIVARVSESHHFEMPAPEAPEETGEELPPAVVDGPVVRLLYCVFRE